MHTRQPTSGCSVCRSGRILSSVPFHTPLSSLFTRPIGFHPSLFTSPYRAAVQTDESRTSTSDCLTPLINLVEVTPLSRCGKDFGGLFFTARDRLPRDPTLSLSLSLSFVTLPFNWTRNEDPSRPSDPLKYSLRASFYPDSEAPGRVSKISRLPRSIGKPVDFVSVRGCFTRGVFQGRNRGRLIKD